MSERVTVTVEREPSVRAGRGKYDGQTVKIVATELFDTTDDDGVARFVRRVGDLISPRPKSRGR